MEGTSTRYVEYKGLGFNMGSFGAQGGNEKFSEAIGQRGNGDAPKVGVA